MGGSPERYKAKTSDGSMADFERQVKNVKVLLDKGLIKNWGLSNENAYGVTMFCIAADKLGVPRPCCIQNDMSLNERSFEGDVAEACHHFGVVGLPYGVLSGGTLAVEATREYAKLAEAWGITPTELAIAWARDRWYNAGVITGTTSPKQVEECLAAFRLERLPEELNSAIDKIHEQYRSPTTTLVNKALLLAAPWVERADECATVA